MEGRASKQARTKKKKKKKKKGKKRDFVTPKGVLPLALCHASATHEGP